MEPRAPSLQVIAIRGSCDRNITGISRNAQKVNCCVCFCLPLACSFEEGPTVDQLQAWLRTVPSGCAGLRKFPYGRSRSCLLGFLPQFTSSFPLDKR